MRSLHPSLAFTSVGGLGYNAAMHRRAHDFPALSCRFLAVFYFRALVLYLLMMGTLWAIGFEGIYAHPTPFYALFAPVGSFFTASGLAVSLVLAGYMAVSASQHSLPWRSLAAYLAIIAGITLALLVWEAHARGVAPLSHLIRLAPVFAWQLPVLGVGALAAFLLSKYLIPALAEDNQVSPQVARRLLVGLFAFSILFACAVAMMRGGLHGIDQAYSRTNLEYIGDIGKTRNIKALFTQYLQIHEHLSMHAKVHPPGPIALLWILSLILLSSSPMTLSLATIVFSALAIFPLYGWAKRITGQRCALIACVCYTLAPSIVLFMATSADALFTPFTLSTLYCFERAIRTRSARFALAAGVGYGILALLKFSLVGIGAYFGLVGLWMLANPQMRWNVLQTAIIMALATGGVLWGVYQWSGYDIIESFHVAKVQFDTDQFHLDELEPRLPFWIYKLLNPMCWFYFAGIPLSLLSLRELFRPDPTLKPVWIVFVLTLIALNLLYLARGEGERSAMYMIPFIAVPAAFHLDRLIKQQGDFGPLWVTAGFLAFQCWFTEAFFYTYW